MKFKDMQEQKDFEKWAFNSTRIGYSMATMHTWNSLHGDLLWLEPADNIEESLKKMYDIYLRCKLETEQY